MTSVIFVPQMQALNPVLVMILIPLFETVVYPIVASLSKLELTPLRKMSTGMMMAGLSFLYVACIQVGIPLPHPPHTHQAPPHPTPPLSKVLVFPWEGLPESKRGVRF
jgi:hypothetical protein